MREFYLKFDSEKYELTENNYWEKVLEPSKVTDDDFIELEQQISKKIPPPLKEFYKLHYSLENEFDCGNAVRIAGNLKNKPTAGLLGYCQGSIGEKMLGLNLIPFGMYNDEWFICFDLNKERKSPPIVLFEMSNWFNGQDAISHNIWFSNFDKFIKCMESNIRNENNSEFVTIDPENNFNSAYDYWK